MNKKIIKRDGRIEDFKDSKILNAISKTFKSLNLSLSEDDGTKILNLIHASIDLKEEVTVEDVQDEVEKALMALDFYDIAKSYILYRNSRTQIREYRDYIVSQFNSYDLRLLFKNIEKDFPGNEYSLLHLVNKYKSLLVAEDNEITKMDTLIKSALELTSIEAPKWDYIAGRIELFKLYIDIKTKSKEYNITSFFSKIKYLVDNDYYGSYLLTKYSEDEINKIEKMILKSRDRLISYSSLDILKSQCLIKTKDDSFIESPQEMFMTIAMHLAMNEQDKLIYVKKFYDILSKFEFVFSLPILKNARRPSSQLSNCFIDIIDDSVNGIFNSISNLASTYKTCSGIGLYLGKLRASSYLDNNYESNNGIIKWLKVINEVVEAINKKNYVNGVVTCYLDVWHKNLLEFLELKNNKGNYEYSILPAICYPDYFWKLARDNINAMWFLMDPHEIYEVKNYHLEDYYGIEWENRYLDCVHDDRINKKEVPIKEIIRLIVKSAFETGTPFCFNRDIANKENPNKHKGMIYASNLCLEIMQNNSSSELLDVSKEVTSNNDEVIVKRYKENDYPTSLIGSICLANLDYESDSKLEEVIRLGVRALDNAIDLTTSINLNSLETLKKYRSLGIGISGYHDIVASKLISFDSEEHLIFANNLFSRISYYVLKASNELAIERGAYPYFNGSEYENGNYFERHGNLSIKRAKLKSNIQNYGLRNGYLLALGSSRYASLISSTSQGVGPISSKFYYETNSKIMMPRVIKGINEETINYYKDAYEINSEYLIKVNQVINRFIDQGITLNLYINNSYSMRQILDLYIKAYEANLKSVYFVRMKSLNYD